MKILVITGSPHKFGATTVLVEAFIKSASQMRHEVDKFESAFEKVNPCMGCDYCKNNDDRCILNDSMQRLYPFILAADVIVFATPLYYYSMSAQLKKVLDRFYAIESKLRLSKKKAVLIATGSDTDSTAMDGLVMQYQSILKYFNWIDAGKVLAKGVTKRADIENSIYIQEANRIPYLL